MQQIDYRVWDKHAKMFIYFGEKYWFDDTRDTITFDCSPVLGESDPDGTRFVFQQYTGFKDGNRKIYTGDILQDDEGDIAEVCWCKSKAAFICDIIGEEGKIYDEFSLEDFAGFIIGNISENPELIK